MRTSDGTCLEEHIVYQSSDLAVGPPPPHVPGWIVPLSAIIGNRLSIGSHISTLVSLLCQTFVRTARDSDSWTRRLSRSIHCLCPSFLAASMRSSCSRKQRQGVRIVICRKSRCLDVMVWSAITIHLGFSIPHRNITSLSLVALDKSIQACLPASANESSSEVLDPNAGTSGTYDM